MSRFLLISIVFFALCIAESCQKADNNPPPVQQAPNTGKLKSYPENALPEYGMEFQYDSLGRIGLIRMGSKSDIDTVKVFYENNEPVRLLRYDKYFNKKVPIFLRKDPSHKLTTLIYKRGVEMSPYSDTNPYDRFNRENDPYYSTLDLSSDVVGRDSFSYNLKGLIKRIKLGTDIFEIDYAPGDTVPVTIHQPYADLTPYSTANLDSVLTKCVNPLHKVFNDIPYLYYTIRAFYPVGWGDEISIYRPDFRVNSVLYFVKYLPRMIQYQTNTYTTPFTAERHYNYVYTVSGQMISIGRNDVPEVYRIGYY